MAVPLTGVSGEKLTDDRLATQCRERQGLDELLGVRGHDDLNLGTCFDEQASECGTLIGGDTTSDAQNDVLAFQHDASVVVLMFLVLDVQFCDDLLGILGKVTLHHPIIVTEIQFSEYLFDSFAFMLAEVEHWLLVLVIDDASG